MFEENDRRMILSVHKIIAEGDFLLKGKAVPGFIMILRWLKELEEKIDEDLKPKVKKEKKVKK